MAQNDLIPVTDMSKNRVHPFYSGQMSGGTENQTSLLVFPSEVPVPEQLLAIPEANLY